MANIRRPILILALVTCTAVGLAVLFAPVIPAPALIGLKMQKAKSEIMRFAHRYNRLPGSIAEVERMVGGSRGVSLRGISMRTLDGGVVVLRLNEYEATFSAKEMRGRRHDWSPIDTPWVVKPHRLRRGEVR